MVNPIVVLKSEYFSKRELVLAITAFVVAFLFLFNFAFAAEMKINEQEIERIKTALSIVQTASNIGNVLVDGGGLFKVLNTTIRGSQTATDVTYGLLVLSAINEMEFMDMVLSQEYKDKERAYFEQVLKERTKLTSHWKGVGFDIPKVISGRITSPIGALALNTFEITDKVILILTEFEVLKKGEQYDGLRYYFDFRKGGDSHNEAWEIVEMEMGFAAKPNPYAPKKLTKNNHHNLESQFASLYEKWSPYATPLGISKEYKEQLASELRTTLATALEENTRVQPLYVEDRSVWDKFVAQLANIKNTLAEIVSQVKNPFSAGPIITELPADNGSPQDQGAEETPEIIEVGPPFNEAATTTEQKVEEPSVLPETTVDDEILEVRPPLIDTERQEPEPEKPKDEMKEVEVNGVGLHSNETQSDPVSFCRREAAGAGRQYRVLINEVAWMGDQESPNNEWIELKNIWGMPVNLNGWQLQDKDQKIKVIFKESDVIPAQGYLALERGKDYTGALNNSNEAIYLFDNTCQLEDEVLANPNWPAGDNAAKKTMQRFDVLYWYSGVGNIGTENSSPPAFLTHPSAAPVPVAPKQVSSYSKIIISETYTGSSDNQKNDFVELYNPNDENADLTDWYIQRKTAGSQDFSTYAPNSLFSGKTIQAKGYFLIANASSTFITTADAVTDYALTEENTLVIKNPKGEITDQVSTGNPSSGKSYGRKWSTSTQGYTNDFENQKPTPKVQNENSQSLTLSVVINEIAWAGTKAKSQDEWIELYNNTTSSVNLADWHLAADDGGPDIIFPTSSVISAGGYFLIERTDDHAVSDILADWSGSFGSGLSNGGETLKLYDNLGNLVNSIDFSSGWPAGQASPSYISMERINSASSSDAGNWASNNRITRNGLDTGNNQINGTPKAQNSVSKPSTQITSGFTITEDATMTYLGSPYLVDGLMIVSGAKLTVEPGVNIKFKHVGASNQNALLKIENGILEASGTADKKIIFTSSSTQPSAGDWDGLYLKNSTSTLNNAVVQYGGLWHQPSSYEFTPYTYGAVYIDEGNAQITNTLIEKNGTYGLWLKNSASTQIANTEFKENQGTAERPAAVYIESSNPTIKNSVFQSNTIGILTEGSASPTIKDNQFIQNTTPIQVANLLTDIGDNVFQNNSDNVVLVRGFGFSDSAQEINWQKINVPYFVDAGLVIPLGYTLKIKPGVEIRLKSSGQITADGNLQANGTSQNKIVFTGASEVPGAWRYIKFSASSANSILEHVIVKYGGYFDPWGGGRYGAVKIDGLNLTIKDSVFENNRVAIEAINADFAGQSSNVAIKNNEVGIYVTSGSQPSLLNITFGTGDDTNSYNILP